MGREASNGANKGGRTVEIQRLIGRSLRAAVDLKKLLGENTITIDCDVIQADGGTRTASLSREPVVALVDAINHSATRENYWQHRSAEGDGGFGVGRGIYEGVPVLDLDYPEDSAADTDMNVIMGESGGFIEVQGTAEGALLWPVRSLMRCWI